MVVTFRMNFGLDRNEPMRDVKQKVESQTQSQEVQGLLDNKIHETTKVFEDLPIHRL